MSENRPPCPQCSSSHIVKNGSTHHKKQKYKCKDCGRQFIKDPHKTFITLDTKALIDRLLLEKIPLAGIARSAQVSRIWLQSYVNRKYSQIPDQLSVTAKPKGKLTLECDELWSFVGDKDNELWLWLAQERQTREIVGVHLGDRSRASAKKLWESLPPVYRQCAISYTDFWIAYEQVFPATRHRQVPKKSGETSHIERFNNTLRQRISRLVRQTLSFSKKTENHLGAILYFINYYNKMLLA